MSVYLRIVARASSNGLLLETMRQEADAQILTSIQRALPIMRCRALDAPASPMALYFMDLRSFRSFLRQVGLTYLEPEVTVGEVKRAIVQDTGD